MGGRVLLVDDNLHILEAVELILSTENYTVRSLTKADTILEETKTFKPDVILLDLLLSGKNGKEVTRELKGDSATKDIPIIIVSAHPSAEKAAKQVGADAFLAKPFDIADLLAYVEKFCKKSNQT